MNFFFGGRGGLRNAVHIKCKKKILFNLFQFCSWLLCEVWSKYAVWLLGSLFFLFISYHLPFKILEQHSCNVYLVVYFFCRWCIPFTLWRGWWEWSSYSTVYTSWRFCWDAGWIQVWITKVFFHCYLLICLLFNFFIICFLFYYLGHNYAAPNSRYHINLLGALCLSVCLFVSLCLSLSLFVFSHFVQREISTFIVAVSLSYIKNTMARYAYKIWISSHGIVSIYKALPCMNVGFYVCMHEFNWDYIFPCLETTKWEKVFQVI